TAATWLETCRAAARGAGEDHRLFRMEAFGRSRQAHPECRLAHARRSRHPARRCSPLVRMTIRATHRKPKLVFFQWDHQPNAEAANYLLLHMQQHVKCLATHFEVVVINHDCDYAAICDRHEPGLALFESGYRSHGSRRIRIINTGARPGVPKLGLHNADPWCDRRAGFLSDMEQWGIETYFSISTMMPEYTPEIAENLFI